VYLEDVFPCVVAGLADDIGTVRDVALKSGQALVIKFARSETDMLLPALETGSTFHSIESTITAPSQHHHSIMTASSQL
jgi:ribosomal 30S subunit maturation factor RimM